MLALLLCVAITTLAQIDIQQHCANLEGYYDANTRICYRMRSSGALDVPQLDDRFSMASYLDDECVKSARVGVKSRASIIANKALQDNLVKHWPTETRDSSGPGLRFNGFRNVSSNQCGSLYNLDGDDRLRWFAYDVQRRKQIPIPRTMWRFESGGRQPDNECDQKPEDTIVLRFGASDDASGGRNAYAICQDQRLEDIDLRTVCLGDGSYFNEDFLICYSVRERVVSLPQIEDRFAMAAILDTECAKDRPAGIKSRAAILQSKLLVKRVGQFYEKHTKWGAGLRFNGFREKSLEDCGKATGDEGWYAYDTKAKKKIPMYGLFIVGEPNNNCAAKPEDTSVLAISQKEMIGVMDYNGQFGTYLLCQDERA